MKTLNRFLLLIVALFNGLDAHSQYFHGYHSDYSIIGNGVQTEWPMFPVNEFGALIGGVGTTMPGMLGNPSPMAICLDHDGNTVFNHTFMYSSCGTQITANSSRIVQLNHLSFFHWLGLISAIQIPNDNCNTYVNTQSGVVQQGYSAGGLLYQRLTPNGSGGTQKGYVWMTNGIPTWDVYDVQITDVQKAVNDPSNPNNDVYVVGNLRWGYEQRAMFAFKFDHAGNAIWHKTYSMGYGFSNPTAHGIVHSLYNPDEVYIVGEIDQIYQGQPIDDGFILTVDANNGSVITNNLYDIGNMDGFKAITVSDDPQSPGFAICGFSHTNAGTAGKTWVVKMDPNMNIEWNNTYTDWGGNFDYTKANAIKGRYSSKYNRYEYYVAGQEGFSSSNVMVMKIRGDGNPIGGVFTWDHGNGEYAVSVDASNVAGADGEGLGVFCYNNDNTKTNVLAIHSYFNGWSPCAANYDGLFAHEEVSNPEYLWAGDNDDWMPYNVSIFGTYVNTGNNVCYFASDPGGSNWKPGKSTGVIEEAYENDDITLVPNPVTDYMSIKNVANASYIIINSIGQEISSGNIDVGNSNIDVSGFEPGIYFITISEKERTKNLKFVKQ